MQSSHSTKIKLRPTNHYLDLIAKIQSKGGETFDLSVENYESIILVNFSHKYNSSDLIFKECIEYNRDYQIMNWTIIVSDKVYTVYSE